MPEAAGTNEGGGSLRLDGEAASLRGGLVPCPRDRAPGVRRGRWTQRIEAHYGAPCREVLARFYGELGLSSRDLAEQLRRDTGDGPSDRQVIRLLRKHGVPVRPRGDAAELRWAKGKGDDVPGKVNRTALRNHYDGAGPEGRFRRALGIALEELHLGAEIVVGDASWSVLPRGEVDIPVILVDPVSQRFCRVAIEVDGTYFHGRPGAAERDARKDWLLRNRGWGVFRVPEARVDEPAAVREAAEEIAAFYQVTVNPALGGQPGPDTSPRLAPETP